MTSSVGGQAAAAARGRTSSDLWIAYGRAVGSFTGAAVRSLRDAEARSDFGSFARRHPFLLLASAAFGYGVGRLLIGR